MQRSCKRCSTSFEITNDDLAFLDALAPMFNGEKIAIPPPTHCHECREQRREAQINEVQLYRHTCDLTKKEIVSNFHEDSPYLIYNQPDWYGDAWDPLQYGKEYDFHKPFFEQYHALCLAVPHPNLTTGYQYDENCEYTNYSGKNKDCYLIFDSDENQDCYYSYSVNSCKNCSDCFRVRKSELCYQCIDCSRCYASSFLQDCNNCTDSMFLQNCIGCKRCLMSSNLHNREYFVENKQVSPDEYERVRKLLTSSSRVRSAADRFATMRLQYPQKFMHGIQNENVLGDYLLHSKNAFHCFDSENLWDCRYCYQAFMPVKDSMDTHEIGDCERCYECSCVGYSSVHLLFCASGLENSNNIYSTFCFHSQNLFGCFGLRRKQYCILNKQYTKEEYLEMVPRILKHMTTTGEWGEFFPIHLAPFSYNESLAGDYYLLTKQDALAEGFAWRDPDPKEYRPQSCGVPDDIKDVPDSITEEILACSSCKKNYKIMQQELAFHRQRSLPLPTLCFLCRYKEQLGKRNPRKLWLRPCAQCGKGMSSSYAPDRPEKVLCEECYLKEVY